MRFQVNYSKVFIGGSLHGRRYHCHELFPTRAAALFFARRDGSTVSPAFGPDYRQEDSSIVDLQQYEGAQS